MKKSFFLFLLLLIGCIGSVSAYGTDTSDYKVVLDNTELTTAETTATLESYTWGGYTPNIVGVDGNVIYLASKSDLARFCSYIDRYNTYLPFSGYFKVYINNELSTPSVKALLKVTRTDEGFYMYANTSKSVQDIYVLSMEATGHSVAVAKTLIDDVVIFQRAGGYAGTYYSWDTITVGSAFKAQAYASDTDSSTSAATCYMVITAFDNLEINVTGDYGLISDSQYAVFQEPMSPPPKYDLTINTNVDGLTVYADGSVLGTADNEEIFSLIPGTYDLTFEKTGYYNVTQTVEIVDTAVNITVDMETTHTPVTLAIIDSEGGLTSVNLYIDGVLTGTVGNNQDVSLPKGTHELIFEKAGYWNETKTVTVDEALTDLSIRMFLDTVMYSVDMPTDLNTYKNSALPIALTINPNAYSQSTKLFISGKDVLDVRDSANEQLTKVDGGYVLGDITSAQDVIVTIDSGEVLGTNTVQIRVTGYGTLGESYVTDASVTYEVLQLPITLTVPTKWNIGSNILRVSETEGLQRVVMIQIDDEDGNLVYSDSYAFEGYESHSFEIPFTETGNYKLKIVSGDSINSYLLIEVTNPVTFLDTTVSGTEGTSSSVILNVQNLFSEPQYYKVTVSGDALSNTSILEFSVSPGVTKNQEISIPVGTNLEYDSYSLVAKVYLKNSDGVYEEIKNQVLVLNIEESSDNFISALIPSGISLGGLDPSTIFDMAKNNPVLIAIIGICVLLGGSTLIPGGRKK
ncbi:hypothetical protein HNP92_000290 [Methanococcus maripaludis]|uniref:PEGA domain-containing protein n=1 Tax=Methanococcus maripaludis TaxID=39152 RepID=A0A7J9S317_METMI|nr:PEGA domain-containing protein [Methanococcus maripaludis]MBB6401005.1 hypothetical protein [Methanococcus maripaludis]